MISWGLAVYHRISVNEEPDLPAVANEQSACWLTPSALDGRCRKAAAPVLAIFGGEGTVKVSGICMQVPLPAVTT